MRQTTLGTEIIFVVEAIDAGHHFGLVEMRIFDVRKLVPAGIGEGFDLEEAFAATWSCSSVPGMA